MEAEQLAPGGQLVPGPVLANAAADHREAHCHISKVEIATVDCGESLQLSPSSLSFRLACEELENGATSALSQLLKTSSSDRPGANGNSKEATVAAVAAVAAALAASQEADASLSQATCVDVSCTSRDQAGARDQDELHLQGCQQKDEDDAWSCCPNNNNNIGVKKDAMIGSGTSKRQDNGANSDERRRILNDTFAVARARDEEPDQAGRRRLDDLGADEAFDLGAASSRGGAQLEGWRASVDDVCGQDAIDEGDGAGNGDSCGGGIGSPRRPVTGSHAQRHGEELNKIRSLIRFKQTHAARSNDEQTQKQQTMIEDFARYQVASQLDALSASLKLASDASDDQANLLNVLHRLGEWRSELRIVDNQLLELVSECFARLGSKPKGIEPFKDNDRAPEGNQSLLVDLMPIDLTQTNQVSAAPMAEKRVKLSSPGINFKKMRLLGATRDESVFLDQKATVSDQVEAANTIEREAQEKTNVDQHNTTDESDDRSDEKPELRKFCSIGTAEISREQFNRQQQMFDLTLAKLAKGKHKTETTKSVTFELSPSQNQKYEVRSSQILENYFVPKFINHQPQKQAEHQFNYQNYDYLRSLAVTATNLNQELSYQAPLAGQIQTAQNQTDHFNVELSHMSIIETGAQLTQNNQALNYPLQSQQLLAASSALVQDHTSQNHFQHRSSILGNGNSAFDNLLRNSTNICKDLVPVVRKMAFKCHVCQSCFEDRHRLQQHLSIHLNLNPSWFEEKTIKETMAQYELRRGDYLCHICKVRYETTSEFDKHMHLHGDKPHQCDLCSGESKFVSFRYFRQLLTHLRSHCFLYSCKFAPECRQTANRKDYLKLHILKHHLNNKLPEQYTICCH